MTFKLSKHLKNKHHTSHRTNLKTNLQYSIHHFLDQFGNAKSTLGGSIFSSSQFELLSPVAIKNGACFKSGQNRLENIYLDTET
jgi:hypothetical protein